MGGKITRESWEIIASEIINIVDECRDYGNDEITFRELEEYLTGEGIIEVIE